MAPASVSLSWAPGERLLASAGSAPSCNVEALPSLPRPFMNLFYAGHVAFLNGKLQLLEKSSSYRSIMIDCLGQLRSGQHAAEQPFRDAAHSLTQAHIVWQFIEQVYLAEFSNLDWHVSKFLADWYAQNYPEAYDAAREMSARLGGERPRDDDDEFWECLVKLAICGEREKVRALLDTGRQDSGLLDEKRPFYDDDGLRLSEGASAPVHPEPVVATVQGLMDCTPDCNIATRSDGTWEDWQAKCRQWADAEELQNHSGAKRLLGLFSGDVNKIAKACTKWEEMFLACSIYAHYGHATGGNLRGGLTLVSNACASASAVFKAPDEVGGALVEAALGNVSNAIVRMDASLPSSWFSAHLCDLLVKAGKMADVDTASWGSDNRPMGIREFYLKEFARGLERYRGCWRIAVDYYAACPAHGTSLLIDLLSRVPFEGPSDPTAEKVLLICRKRRLNRTGQNICEKLGADCLDQQHFGGAMYWFARAGLSKRAQWVADFVLVAAEMWGAGSQAARSLECVVCAFTNAGDDIMREIFDYMRVYSQMQRSLFNITRARREGAQELLTDNASGFVTFARRLVGGGGLPRRFWIVVAYEAARVLELYPELGQFFSRGAVNELLGALQLASGPYRSLEMIEGLRGRLACETRKPSQTAREQVELSSVEEAESALQHCRSIFIRSAAARINA